MNIYEFNCQRHHIESILEKPQKNLLIQLYCSPKFAFFNMVDLYYRIARENAILMFVLIGLSVPFLFMCIGFLAEKYLSKGMKDISKRFKLSPSIAAITLVAFANGAPDLISSLADPDKQKGEVIMLGNMLGGFIFSVCLVLSNVLWNTRGGTIQMPKYTILKDLGFYLLVLIVITLFGIWGKTTYLFIFIFFILYGVYLYVSIVVEQWDKAELLKTVDTDSITTQDESVNQIFNLQQPKGGFVSLEEKDSSLTYKKDHGFFEQVIEDLIDEEMHYIENMIIMPLALAGMLTICYLDNPIMKTPFKYLLIGSSITTMLFILELTEFNLLILIIIGQISGLCFFIFEVVDFSKNMLAVVYEFITVFASIGWISVFADTLVDFMRFLAFYFDINELILAAVLLSAGSFVSDYFGNAALAKHGEPVMAALGCFSGEIFNNYIGFGLGVLVNFSVSDSFDIFGIHAPKCESGEEMNEEAGFSLYDSIDIVLCFSYCSCYMLSYQK